MKPLNSLVLVLYLSLLLLAGNWVHYLVCLSRRSSFEGRWLLHGTLLGFGVLTLYLILRGLRIGHPPFTTAFEIYVLFSWSILSVFLLLNVAYRLKAVGSFVLPAALVFLLLAQLHGREIIHPSDLSAIFQSGGAWVHIFLIVWAYGAFTVSFLLAAGYLRAEHQLRAKSVDHFFFLLPPLDVLDRGLQSSIWLGVVSLLVGVVVGAFQGILLREIAVGWFLDPNVMGAIITALIYGTILVIRKRSLFTNRRIAYLAISGFVFIVLLFFGMNFLSSMHRFL